MADYLESLSNISESGEETLLLTDADHIIKNIVENGEIAIICEPCGEDGIEIKARGYCEDCGEYLCETCYTHHLTPRPFRYHALQELHELPKENGKFSTGGQPMARCSLHPEKKIVAYCNSHDQLCCQCCILIGHRVCNDVKSVDELGKGIESNEDFKKFYAKLLGMEQQYQINQQAVLTQIDTIEKYYNDAIEQYRIKLDALKSKDIEKVTEVRNVYDSAANQTGQWITEMEYCWVNRDFGQLFTLVKLTGKHLAMIDNNVHKLCDDKTIERYRFVADAGFDRAANTLGVLETVTHSVRKINVKQVNENFNCTIRDIALLAKDLMLVTDYGSNCSIKLIDTKANEIVSSIELNSGPWQMTVTDKKQVYVTVPGNRKLLHLRSPTVDVSDIREIAVNEQCAALEFHENVIKVQCISPCKLLEIDTDGRIQKLLHNDISATTAYNGEQYVTHPYCSVLNKETGSMFVSCYNQNSITEISHDGNIKLLVKSEELNSPFGLCMDCDGSFVVCSCNGKSVLRVTPGGDIENILPEPLDFNPSALALDSDNRILYVGGNHDNVYVYDI